jgi:hypothetical protein
MTVASGGPYTPKVDVRWFRASRWITAGLGVVLAASLTTAPASAETASFDVGDQVVVAVVARGRGNDVTVRTWDRPTVQIDSPDGPPMVERRVVSFGSERVPLNAPIPPLTYTLRDSADGQLRGTLPPEEFPYAGFRPGPHDVIRVTADAGAHLVITVPASTGLLRTAILGGTTTIEDYHGANLYLLQGSGRVNVSGASTTAFVQLNSGRVELSDSSFDRIRLRANGAHVVFERCRSSQIEVTTVSGAVVYDGGTFDPGLARFESQSGNIALGSAASAQLAGRSQQGRVFTMFDERTPVAQSQDGTSTASLGGSSTSPLVNAFTDRGNVYLYDGELANHHDLPAEWRPVRSIIAVPRRQPLFTPRLRRIRQPN